MIYLELLWTFFKIGAFTFGGGYAMLPLIQQEVLTHGWMEQEAIINFIAISESTPGPFAINMATYVGSQMGGLFGAFCATLGVVLPSFIVIVTIAKCYDVFKKSKIVKGGMSGLKPAAVGLIGSAVISVASAVFIPNGFTFSIFTQPTFYVSLFIFMISVVLAFKKTHPIIVVGLSALLGIVFGIIM